MTKQYITKEKNFISIVTYIYNNDEYIEDFLKKLDNILKENFESYEFIIVNNDSDDNSVNKIKSISKYINGKITIVNLAWKHNIELAMLSGVDIAIGDFIFEFDSPVIDFEVDEIINVYNKCLTGYDVVSCIPNESIKLTSKIFYKFLNKISYRNMELTTETFRIISRRALNRVLRSKEVLRYRKALYHYSGFETTTIGYNPIKSNVKKNDITFGEKVNLSSNILIGFSDIGAKLTNLISLVFFIISIGMGIYTINSYFTLDNIQAGWTTTMLFLSLGFTGLFLILSILARYMVIILTEIQDKPKYVFKSIDKL